MPIDYREFIHPDDASALETLRAVPGFSTFAKKFSEIFTERVYRLENTSSNLRLGPYQLPEIYNLLPPICKKLGIPEPELYLKHDRIPNAYTAGDTTPFIVVTLGLLETMHPDEIQAVLAHECGHILCRHVLYHTMGTWLLSASSAILERFGLLSLAVIPLKMAFYYWIRASEFSADRVAAYYCGGPDKFTDSLLRLTGATKNLSYHVDKEMFMQQAKNYKYELSNSKVDKAFEFIIYNQNDHPLIAYRAYDLTEWCKSAHFKRILNHIDDLPSEFDHEVTSNARLIYEQVGYLDGSVLSSWFAERKYLNGKQMAIFHCKMSGKDFSNLNIDNSQLDHSVYQFIIDKNNDVVAHRLLTYSTINSDLEEMFRRNNGVIIVE